MDTSFTESPDHTESPADEDTFADTRRNLLDDFACPTPMKASNVEPGEEHMKVFLRIRPFTEEEENTGEKQDCVELENENLLTMHAPKDSVTFKNSAHGCGKTTHKFTFSKIFPEDTTQKLFFDESMLSTVKDFVEGQNCLVFTYGITNAGKTYTIQGNPKDGGILPRTLDVLFNSIDNRQWENMTLKPKMFCDVIKLNEKDIENEMKIKEKVFRMATDEEPDVTTLLGDDASDMSKLTNTTVASEESIVHASSIEGGLDDLDDAENRIREEMAINVAAQGQIKFSVWISFAEIYNEYIYDLLEPLPKKKNARRQVLSLREDKNGSPYIKGLKHIHVTSADEAYKVLTIGKKNLQFACTKLNQSSSRSHCIFNIKVLRVVDKENPNMCRMSMLSLVDLAGSERCTKTQNTGDRLKEAGNINTSLLTLGRCISTLRYNQLHKENSKIIPFRESKLTRLFQSYFCGKGRACMIVNVNQLASAFDETLHVLKFSAIAKQVIVQKEEPKPKKSALRSAARFVSLALAHNPGGARPSISWASPGTMDLPQMEHAMNLPIPEGDESELIELENEREEELLAIITGLKEEILAERRKQATLEVQIREEVCQEMAQQLVEIENQYSERLREGYQAAEEKADRRIDMYTQSVKASRKRARIQRFEDEEDEWVSSVLLHAEQTKVKELENKLEEQKDLLRTVEADLEHAQSSLKEAMNKRNSLQEEKSKSEFQMASDMSEMKKSHEKALLELQAKLNELETNMTPENEAEQLPSKKPEGSDDMSKFVHDEIINNLTQQLKDAKETIATQASQISELNEMLTEAGETFEEKNQEIEKLKNTVSEDEERLQQQVTALEDLQKLVSESKQALVEAERKLAERDHTLVELRQHIDVQKGTTKTTTDLNSSILLTPRSHDPNSSVIAQMFPNVGIGVVSFPSRHAMERESCFSVCLSDSQVSEDEITFKTPRSNKIKSEPPQEGMVISTQTTPSSMSDGETNTDVEQGEIISTQTSPQNVSTPIVHSVGETQTVNTQGDVIPTQTTPAVHSIGETQTSNTQGDVIPTQTTPAVHSIGESQTSCARVDVIPTQTTPAITSFGEAQNLEMTAGFEETIETNANASLHTFFTAVLPSATVSPSIDSSEHQTEGSPVIALCKSHPMPSIIVSNEQPISESFMPENQLLDSESPLPEKPHSVSDSPLLENPESPLPENQSPICESPVLASSKASTLSVPTNREVNTPGAVRSRTRATPKRVQALTPSTRINYAPLVNPHRPMATIPVVKFSAGFRRSDNDKPRSKLTKTSSLANAAGKENASNKPKATKSRTKLKAFTSKQDLKKEANKAVLSPLRNSFVEQQTKTSLMRLCTSPHGQARCANTTCHAKRTTTDTSSAGAPKLKKRKVGRVVARRSSTAQLRRYNTRSRPIKN